MRRLERVREVERVGRNGATLTSYLLPLTSYLIIPEAARLILGEEGDFRLLFGSGSDERFIHDRSGRFLRGLLCGSGGGLLLTFVFHFLCLLSFDIAKLRRKIAPRCEIWSARPNFRLFFSKEAKK